MEQKKLDRINELARKSRTPEGLSAAEKTEQDRLRQEYVAAFRADIKNQLENIVLLRPDGTKTRLEPKS